MTTQSHEPIELTSLQQETVDEMATEYPTVFVDRCPPYGAMAVLATGCRFCPRCGGDGCSKCDQRGAIPMAVPVRILPNGERTSAAAYLPVD